MRIIARAEFFFNPSPRPPPQKLKCSAPFLCLTASGRRSFLRAMCGLVMLKRRPCRLQTVQTEDFFF